MKKVSREPKPFIFKQFSLSDAHCAMKIGTDGVLLGSYAADFAAKQLPKNILDIGTGCGILALMMAQKTTACIDAIDIDPPAYLQAKENFSWSPWSKRLHAILSPIQKFRLQEKEIYDLIVSNPPYFQKSMPSPQLQRNQARHNHSLSFRELFRAVHRLLNSGGTFVLIIPTDLEGTVLAEAQDVHLNIHSKLYIKPNHETPAKRLILTMNKLNTEPLTKREISIETGKRHCFTNEYKALTKDYHPFL